jgi:hypothetical protein
MTRPLFAQQGGRFENRERAKLSPSRETMDRAQLRTEGVAFGRILQTGYKSVVMYNSDHPAVERAIQQAYDSLKGLLQHMPQLIFGFMNNRLLLNDFLTSEPSLRLLDTEFNRRGIAAVTFLT